MLPLPPAIRRSITPYTASLKLVLLPRPSGNVLEFSSEDRPRIVVVADHYLPGWKAGGPIRSLSNLVAELGDEFDFRVVTRDRDRDDSEPYPGVALDSWVTVGKAGVFYGTPTTLSPRRLNRIIAEAKPQLVYLNSVFSRLAMAYLAARRLQRAKPAVVINPRGELDPGAMSIKPLRKKVYLTAARFLGFFSRVHWHASTVDESRYIKSRIRGADALVATNLPMRPPQEPLPALKKLPGSARFVFIARVGRKKNLPFLLDSLRRVRGEVELGIYGRKLDPEWPLVERIIDKLPDHVRATYGGAPPHEQVDHILGDAHFYALPTLAESFGHSIYEALSAGRPIVISDRTPWRGLADVRAGWDLSLTDQEAWVNALQLCVDMDQGAYDAMSHGAHALALQWYDAEDRPTAHAEVFRAALDGFDH